MTLLSIMRGMSRYFPVYGLLSTLLTLTLGERVLLDFDKNPQRVLKFGGAFPATQYDIEVNHSHIYKFSVVLEQMKAWTCVGRSDTYPFVVVERDTSFDTTCLSDIDYQRSEYQVTPFFWTSSSHVRLLASGAWGPKDSARFVVTVFMEVEDCSFCPNNTFCCHDAGCSGEVEPHHHLEPLEPHESNKGGTLNGSNWSLSSLLKFGKPKSRCIPLQLTCNGHANCGLLCNADESSQTCSGGASIYYFWRTINLLALFMATHSFVNFSLYNCFL